MSLTIRAAALRAATATLMITALGAGTLAHAGPRSSAPIRMASAPVAQPASQNISYDLPSDFFAYPDEAIPARYARSGPVKRPKIQTASLAAQYQLPFVDPAEYSEYVKIGGSYTVNGVKYTPEMNPFYNEVGVASWYGPGFHGNDTANGEVYDMHAFTAAHPTLPLPCFAEVTNLSTGESVVVRINDRGPFAKNRIIDLSRAAAEKVSVVGPGSAQVRVKYLGPAPKAETLPELQYASAPAPQQKSLASAVKEALPNQFIQMGSFQDKKNAESLKAQLRAHDKSADVVFARVNGSKYYRVILGPFNDKSDADTKLQQMSRLGFNGMVVRNP